MTRPSPSVPTSVLTVVAFVLVMALGLAALGGGVGSAELSIWFAVVLAGCALIVTRHRRARAAGVGA